MVGELGNEEVPDILDRGAAGQPPHHLARCLLEACFNIARVPLGRVDILGSSECVSIERPILAFETSVVKTRVAVFHFGLFVGPKSLSRRA
jgi:hypothetical protein